MKKRNRSSLGTKKEAGVHLAGEKKTILLATGGSIKGKCERESKTTENEEKTVATKSGEKKKKSEGHRNTNIRGRSKKKKQGGGGYVQGRRVGAEKRPVAIFLNAREKMGVAGTRTNKRMGRTLTKQSRGEKKKEKRMRERRKESIKKAEVDQQS